MAAILGMTVGVPTLAGADSGGVPSMVANPSLNLSDTDVTTVTVQITRALAGTNVTVMLCAYVPGGLFDCDNANGRTFTVAGDGSVLGTMPVDYLVGIYGCDEIAPSYRCELRATYANGPLGGQLLDTQTMRFTGHSSGAALAANPRFELSDTVPTNVAIEGMGLVPNTTVNVRQCTFPALTCLFDPVTVAADGTFTKTLAVRYRIYEGIPSSWCNTVTVGSCVINVVYTGGPGVTPGQQAAPNLPISFRNHSLLNVAPSANLVASPNAGDAGLIVTASGSGSTPNGGTAITSYTFDWGDGTTTGPQTSAQASHIYNTYGNPHTLTLTVTNAAGVTATATRAIFINDVTPTAVIDTAFVGANRLRINGTGSLPNGGSPIATYTFNFGDGTVIGPQTSPIAERTYAAPGSYTVGLTVRNQSNLGSTSTAQVSTTDYNAAPEIRVISNLERMATDGATTVLLLDVSRTTDAEGNLPIAYEVDWGDPAPGVSITSGPGPVFNHVYETQGARTVRITATDSTGKTSTTTRVIRVYSQRQLFGLATGTRLRYTTPTVPATDITTGFDYTVNLTDTTATISGSGTGTTSANIPLATAKACITEHWSVSYSPSTTTVVTPSSTNFDSFLTKPVYAMMTAPSSNPATVGTGPAPKQLVEQCSAGRKAVTLGAAGTGQASIIAGAAPAPGIKIRCLTHWQMFSVYNNNALYKRSWSKAAPVVCKL